MGFFACQSRRSRNRKEESERELRRLDHCLLLFFFFLLFFLSSQEEEAREWRLSRSWSRASPPAPACVVPLPALPFRPVISSCSCEITCGSSGLLAERTGSREEQRARGSREHWSFGCPSRPSKEKKKLFFNLLRASSRLLPPRPLSSLSNPPRWSEATSKSKSKNGRKGANKNSRTRNSPFLSLPRQNIKNLKNPIVRFREALGYPAEGHRPVRQGPRRDPAGPVRDGQDRDLLRR